ncbi:putative irregular chiasm C-roughest protein [Penaeus vannamei]|uniref:Putative irregular chiasm C-roughest protein n=1 Tax=Penaeus vannamei TaxID=6689 RepID=A0A3R7PI93_PENVA|nr:putative irregular chiasm C-roughest protein [Penaeus vannamei]
MQISPHRWNKREDAIVPARGGSEDGFLMSEETSSDEIQWVDDSRRETIRTASPGTRRSCPTGSEPPSSHASASRRAAPTTTPPSRASPPTRRSVSPLKSSIQLKVLFPPEVRLSVKPQALVEGDDATFYCNADANPGSITYRWYHNSHLLQNETARSLTLSKISRNFHQDAISCEVSNKVGTSKKTQSVHVQYGPTFRSLPRDVASEEGKEVVLKCDVDSNPPSSIVWLKEGNHKGDVVDGWVGCFGGWIRGLGRDWAVEELIGWLWK